MLKLNRHHLLPALTIMLLPAIMQAQVFPTGNGIVLSGKTQFDLYVQIGQWQDMRVDASEFRLAALRRWESVLREAGISRRPANRNYVVCSVQAIRTGNQVGYSASVEYWGLESTDVHMLLWQHGAVHITAANRFNEGLIAEQCANSFLSEWQKWNPDAR